MRVLLVLLICLGCVYLVAAGCNDCQNKPCPKWPNPVFNKECSVNVVLVLDRSGSINTAGAIGTVRTAIKDFWKALSNILEVGGQVNLGLVEFGTTARLITNSHTLDAGFLAKLDGYANGNAQNFAATGGCNSNTCSYAPCSQCTRAGGSETNWGQAMKLTAQTTWTHEPDIVVWFTDGQPTTSTGLDCSSYCMNSGEDNDLITGCYWSNENKKKGRKVFLVGVGGVSGRQSEMRRVTGDVEWTTQSVGTFATSDYIQNPDLDNLGDIMAAVAVSLCPCAARLQQPVCEPVGGAYCDKESAFRSHVRISASKTTTQWPKQAVLTAIMYYNFQTNEERIGMQFFDPADANAISASPQATILREDITNPCATTRRVFCKDQCFTATDNHIIPRLFKDSGPTYTDLVGSQYCFDANNGCKTGTTCGAGCNFVCLKKATTIPALQGRQEAAEYVQGFDTNNGAEFVICAAKTFDGTIFEFFKDHNLVPGVTFGTLDGNGVYQLTDPKTGSNFNFDRGGAGVCPAARCNENSDVVFLMDEHQDIDTTSWGSFWKDWMTSTIGHYAHGVAPAGNPKIQFGVGYGGGGYSANTLTGGASVSSVVLDIDGHAKAASTSTNYWNRIQQTIAHFWDPIDPTGVIYHAPRRLVIMVGTATINVGSGRSNTLRALYAQYDVTVWVVGIGAAGGNTNTVRLENMASSSQTVLTFPTGPILSTDADTMWARLCPGNEKICGECAGWCNCDVCYCPLCVVTNACQPAQCTVAVEGCTGQGENCLANSLCTTPTCTDSNGVLVPGGTAICNYQDISATYIAANCITTNICAATACDAVDGCKYSKEVDVASVCNDNDICTIDTCPYVTEVVSGKTVPVATGVCVYTPIPFGPSNPTCGTKPCAAGCGITDKCLPTECFQLDSECVARFTSNPTLLSACQAAVAVTPFKYCHTTPVTCQANTFCTTWQCDSGTGDCVPTDRTDCNDNNACTTDTCPRNAAACVYTNSVTCPTDKFCTTYACNTGTGVCDLTERTDCNDNNACTKDSCPSGGDNCVYNVDVICPTDKFCTNYTCNTGTGNCDLSERTNCNDGSKCTSDSCPSGGDACLYTISKTCPQNDTCTNHACNAGTGDCDSFPAIVCDDSDACTIDTCDPSVSGGCVYTPKTCDDGSSCTIDSCNSTGQCVYREQNGGTGACCVNSTACGDANACTKDDCYDNIANCTTSGDEAACIAAIQTGNPNYGGQRLWCVNNVSVVCQTDNVCTTFTCNSADGVCYSAPAKTCDDNSNCTTDTCDPSVADGCVFTNKKNCGVSDVCTNRGCTNSTGDCFSNVAKTCDDSSLCTTDSCDAAKNPTTGCIFTPNSNCAAQNNVCFNYTCDPATGGCVANSILTCDDGSLCTTDSCDPVRNPTTGCVFTPNIDCSVSNNVCTNFTCAAATGRCVGASILTCNDNSACTTDICDATRNPTTGCVYTSNINCAAQNTVCTNYVCNAGTGKCDGTNILTCDDSNACTNDICDAVANPTTGCVYTANHNCASQNTVCTSYSCAAATGNCVPTPILTCNDNNQCTDDKCDAVANPTTGCVYTSSVSTIAELNATCHQFVGDCDLTCRRCTCTPTSCTIVIDTTTQPVCDRRSLCPSTYSCPTPQFGGAEDKCRFRTCIGSLTQCATADNPTACQDWINNSSQVNGYCSTRQTSVAQGCTSTKCFTESCTPATGTCAAVPTNFTNNCTTFDPCNPGLCAIVGGEAVCNPDTANKVECTQPNACQRVECVKNGTRGVCSRVVNITCPAATYEFNNQTFVDNCKTTGCDISLGCTQDLISCPSDVENCVKTLGCFQTNNADSVPAGCQVETITTLIDFCGKCKGGNVGCFLSDIPFVNSGGIAGGVIAGVVVAGIIAAALAVFGSKKGYDHYKGLADRGMTSVGDNPMYAEGTTTGEMLQDDAF